MLRILPPNSMYKRRLGSHQLDRSDSITTSVQWHCPNSNLANNFLASACDSRRPVAGPYQFVMTDGSDEQLFGAI